MKIIHKSDSQIELNLKEFQTRFLRTINSSEFTNSLTEYPIKDYSNLSCLISAISNISSVLIKSELKKEQINPSLLKDVSILMDLIPKLIPYDEFKGLDYILELLDIKKKIDKGFA